MLFLGLNLWRILEWSESILLMDMTFMGAGRGQTILG